MHRAASEAARFHASRRGSCASHFCAHERAVESCLHESSPLLEFAAKPALLRSAVMSLDRRRNWAALPRVI